MALAAISSYANPIEISQVQDLENDLSRSLTNSLIKLGAETGTLTRVKFSGVVLKKEESNFLPLGLGKVSLGVSEKFKIRRIDIRVFSKKALSEDIQSKIRKFVKSEINISGARLKTSFEAISLAAKALPSVVVKTPKASELESFLTKYAVAAALIFSALVLGIFFVIGLLLMRNKKKEASTSYSPESQNHDKISSLPPQIPSGHYIDILSRDNFWNKFSEKSLSLAFNDLSADDKNSSALNTLIGQYLPANKYEVIQNKLRSISSNGFDSEEEEKVADLARYLVQKAHEYNRLSLSALSWSIGYLGEEVVLEMLEQSKFDTTFLILSYYHAPPMVKERLREILPEDIRHQVVNFDFSDLHGEVVKTLEASMVRFLDKKLDASVDVNFEEACFDLTRPQSFAEDERSYVEFGNKFDSVLGYVDSIENLGMSAKDLSLVFYGYSEDVLERVRGQVGKLELEWFDSFVEEQRKLKSHYNDNRLSELRERVRLKAGSFSLGKVA